MSAIAHPMIDVTSVLPASSDTVWEWITSPEGINDELMPVMRMTVPASLKGKKIQDLELGKRAGRSWLLLFGLFPIDYDDLMLAEREPGRRFLETSTMLSFRTWRHERSLRPVDGGCELTDRIDFEPRVPGTGRVLRFVIHRLIAHRHRRLERRFR